jgi:hypothetical protein
MNRKSIDLRNWIRGADQEGDGTRSGGVDRGVALHVSDTAALAVDILDPARARHILEHEKEWINWENEKSTSSSPEALTEKNEIEGVEEGRDIELQRIQSKMSLEVMMADFPDGGKWAWLSLVGATLMGFCTFGMLLRRLANKA